MYYTPDTVAFLDGEFVPAAQATCGVYAQSLHYGYAVFEGIRGLPHAGGPRIFKAEEHYERLHYSCRAIGLPLTYSVEELTRLSYEVLERNGLQDAYIRPLVFAGAPNMSLQAATTSNVLIAVWEWGKYLGDQSLRLTISPYERPNPRAVPIEAKVAGHYVNSIVASTEAKGRGFDEALLLDMNGFVAEGPGANFFFERGGELFTPPSGQHSARYHPQHHHRPGPGSRNPGHRNVLHRRRAAHRRSRLHDRHRRRSHRHCLRR